MRDWAIVDRFHEAQAHKTHVCIMARLSPSISRRWYAWYYDVDAMARMRQSNDSATVCKQMCVRVYFILKRDRSLFIANADERATNYRSKSNS